MSFGFRPSLRSWRFPGISRVFSSLLVLLSPVVFSACQSSQSVLPLHELIPLAWQGYQHRFIEAEGRVRRPLNQNDTVSEGQAYALLIAVALDDQATFDRVLAWTTRHLSRSQQFGDRLLAWHWELGQGVTDWNSAADAEVDLALALLLAHVQWQDERYHREALLLLQDILDLETEVIAGKRYLLPGNWRLDTAVQPLNPSYFSPAHFRLFYAVTGDVRWKELLQSTYAFLHGLPRQQTLPIQPGLVPDWVGIDPQGNFGHAEGFSSYVTWDAVRMPWRVALDKLWGQEACGQDYLRDITEFWTHEWKKRNGKFFLEYDLVGQALDTQEQVGAYAMSLPALYVMQSPLTFDVLQKVQKRFDTDNQYFQQVDDYYQNSLSLLGLLSLPPSSDSDIPSLVRVFRGLSQSDQQLCTGIQPIVQ